jgi:sterol desaturase/sphingolipid hydroxylase (fatty acid hydroxylase superfamily)
LNTDLILLALAPVFLICIGLECLYWRRHGRPERYDWPDVLSNGTLALMHQVADALVIFLFVRTVYQWTYAHGLRLVQPGVASFFLLFLLQDFLYYWFHRASHRVRWMWASHVTHHSSDRLNLSTAFRQSFTYPVSGMWIFWIPIAWVGFTPDQVILIVGLNLAYQFFVHTQLVQKLGWLEYVINTPSVHRVHHARNPQYIDHNYAGVLVIWDRLFGSYVEEVEPCIYGITKPIPTHNPLTLTFHEWRDMFADCWRDRTLKYLWMPPEWQAKPGLARAEEQLAE